MGFENYLIAFSSNLRKMEENIRKNFKWDDKKKKKKVTHKKLLMRGDWQPETAVNTP